jgi:hypothetical protein
MTEKHGLGQYSSPHIADFMDEMQGKHGQCHAIGIRGNCTCCKTCEANDAKPDECDCRECRDRKV